MKNLHSSMVRLETAAEGVKDAQKSNLHSSMVRLETIHDTKLQFMTMLFTFQYGQIRNRNEKGYLSLNKNIYIPVWLDQKRWSNVHRCIKIKHLHSSMVRLETPGCCSSSMLSCIFTFQYGQIRNRLFYNRFTKPATIYIPVWLDQKIYKVISSTRIVKIYIPVWLDQKLKKTKKE